jgi:ribosome-binding ATPase YchF (GTP1/OBG family)
MRDEFVHSDVIVIPRSMILDLLILDMEKIEIRLTRLTENTDKVVMEKCMDNLEKEIPLCDVELNNEEKKILMSAAPYSLKPVVMIKGTEDVDTIISLALKKADQMFFYTSGPTESHAWLAANGTKIINCAAKIHTDLARGFIKGDVVSYDDYMSCHNFNDCRTKGLVRVTDRDYIVQPCEIVEIRFNV